MKVYFIICFLLLSTTSFGQDYISKTYDLDQSGFDDRFTAMIAHEENLFFLARYKYLDTENNFKNGTKVVKMDSSGNILNSKDFPWMQEQTTYGMNMIVENNDLLILNSYELDFQENKNSINILKLSLELDSLNLYEYNPLQDNPLEAADASLTSFKDHFIATGWIDNDNLGDGENHFVMWINKENFNLDSTTFIPDNLIATPDSLIRANVLFSFVNNNDDKLYLFFKWATRNLQNLNVSQHSGFISYDSINDTMPDIIKDDFTNYNHETTPFITSEGLLIYEEYFSPDIFNVVCKDLNGTTIWNNINVPTSPYGNKQILSFTETMDGNIIGVGFGNWFLEEGQVNPDTITFFEAPYLVKIDITNGEIIWEKFIIRFELNDFVSGHDFVNVLETEEGDLICAGSKKNEIGSFYTQDSWLIKLDSNGCNPDFSCNEIFTFLSSTNEVEVNDIHAKINIYPNPFSKQVNIKLIENFNYYLIVTNLSGQQIINDSVNSTNLYTLDMSNFVDGVYFIDIISKKGNLRKTVLKHTK